MDRTSRQSDPNAPVYHVNGMGYYDDPLGTKPTKPKPFIPESMLLVTKDIMNGTGYPMYRERRDHARTNFCADIEGAMPDTIRHAIVTNRRTNPLVPVYQGLDYGDPLPPLLVPLLPSSMVTSPTLRPKLDPADMDMRPKVTHPLTCPLAPTHSQTPSDVHTLIHTLTHSFHTSNSHSSHTSTPTLPSLPQGVNI